MTASYRLHKLNLDRNQVRRISDLDQLPALAQLSLGKSPLMSSVWEPGRLNSDR